MATNKVFLDQLGLSQYDELLKEYIKGKVDSEETRAEGAEANLLAAINALAKDDADAIAANKTAIETNAADIAANKTDIEAALKALAEGAVADNASAIAKLNGAADVEGSVAYQVNAAVNGIVNGAPEALDTLKEIADWISSDETGTAALVGRVSDLEAAHKDLKEYVDAQDQMYYDSIISVSELKIASLFPLEQEEGQSAANAIGAVAEGKAVKLVADQTVEDNIVITKSCYIDANGSTFTGTVTIPKDKEVVIENATFSQPVVVA